MPDARAMPPPLKPVKAETAIRAKADHIAEQQAMLQRNQRIVRRLGGQDTVDLGDELAFQQGRADVVAWCETHTAKEIAARRTALHARLGPDGVAAKGGSMIGLPREIVALIAEAELLDLALGDL